MLQKFKLLVTFKNPFIYIYIFKLLAGYVIRLEWFCEDNIEIMVCTALLLSCGQINQFHRFCKFSKLGKAFPKYILQKPKVVCSTSNSTMLQWVTTKSYIRYEKDRQHHNMWWLPVGLTWLVCNKRSIYFHELWK